MKTVVEILKEARELVAKGWTRGCSARDAKGDFVRPESPDATCWCAYGAVARATDDEATGKWAIATRYLGDAVGYHVPAFNDAPGRTQVEVLAVFDAAIAKAKADVSAEVGS